MLMSQTQKIVNERLKLYKILDLNLWIQNTIKTLYMQTYSSGQDLQSKVGVWTHRAATINKNANKNKAKCTIL